MDLERLYRLTGKGTKSATQEADVKVKSLYLEEKNKNTKIQACKLSTKGQTEAKAKKKRKKERKSRSITQSRSTQAGKEQSAGKPRHMAQRQSARKQAETDNYLY